MHSKQQQRSPHEEEKLGRVHPTGLGAGTRVGDWRLLAQSDAGSFGVVYLAVRVGEEAAGPCALKLARARGDARLRREVGLLERVSHPNVPRLRGHGEWYGFPYGVMDWVEGAALYRWSRLCNPTRREVTRLLARVAGALAAVHTEGGAHRDLKGENVLVRLADNEPFLTDFGAGTWEGAAPVTVEGPPGTPQYYSPERLRAHLNLLPPGAPHGAGSADDVYGLGVTAYRLLTDTYPFTEVEEAQRTQERLRGSVPRAPQELNPNVPPELDTLVVRMLAARPEERPSAQEVTQNLEACMQASGESWEDLLFTWETEASRLGPGRRLSSRMQYELLLVQARAEEHQARVAAELERVHAEQHEPMTKEPELPRPHRRTSVFERLHAQPWNPTAWTLSRTPRPALPRPTDALLTGLAVAGLIFLVAREWWPDHRPSIEMPAEVAQQASDDEDRDGGVVGLGDTPLSTPASVASLEPVRGDIGVDLPKKPLPGQRRPPCKKPTVEIHGGCWVGPIEDESPPCGDQSYEWKDRCYWPFMAPGHPPTSEEQ